jgi:uncharacterized protein YjeT (DUF2065 family)
MTTTTTLAALTLSNIRLLSGITFLATPSHALRGFSIPQATADDSVLTTRMAGARELVNGVLLLYSLRQWRAAASSSGMKAAPMGKGSSEEAALLGSAASASKGIGERHGKMEGKCLLAYVLLAGVAIDGMDALIALLGFMEGWLQVEAAVRIGGMALFACGLGVVGYLGGSLD